MSAPALCRGCGKSDQVTVVDALAATTECSVGGANASLADGMRWLAASRDGEVPVRVVVIYCARCSRLLGKPELVARTIVVKDTGGKPPQRAR